jgi:hypothetical protein
MEPKKQIFISKYVINTIKSCRTTPGRERKEPGWQKVARA